MGVSEFRGQCQAIVPADQEEGRLLKVGVLKCSAKKEKSASYVSGLGIMTSTQSNNRTVNT